MLGHEPARDRAEEQVCPFFCAITDALRETSPPGTVNVNTLAQAIRGKMIARGLLDQAARITELEAALRDCTAFVVIHVDKWTRDNGHVMHETHRELLDRIGRLTGRDDLVQRLEAMR